MSKQQRPAVDHARQRAVDLARADGARADGERETDASVGEQHALGNQALASQLVSEGREDGDSAQAVRADAMSLVERGMVALYTTPRATDRVERFVQVLEASRLPADRKSVLVDKLVGDQESAVAIERAAERWFGGSGEEARQAGLVALDGVWEALGHEGVALSEGAREGAEGSLAEQLVGELAAERGDPAMGEAVRGFCREVYLIVAWHHDEEEDEDTSFAAPLELE